MAERRPKGSKKSCCKEIVMTISRLLLSVNSVFDSIVLFCV